MMNRYQFAENNHFTQLISYWIIACGAWVIIANYLDRNHIYISV